MILSMTGFSSISREFPGGMLSLELRAVNHRYLDVQMRLPEELRIIEPQLREIISGKVTRGKLECRVGLNQLDSTNPTMEVNVEYLDKLLAVASELQDHAQGMKGLSVGELMRWPGVLRSNELAPEVLHKLCLTGLSTVLADFNASRAREGEKLKAVLLERVESMPALKYLNTEAVTAYSAGIFSGAAKPICSNKGLASAKRPADNKSMMHSNKSSFKSPTRPKAWHTASLAPAGSRTYDSA